MEDKVETKNIVHKEDKSKDLLQKKKQLAAIQQSPDGFLVDHNVLQKFYHSYSVANKFNLDNSLLCTSNFDVDRALAMKDPIDPAALIGVPFSITTSLKLHLDGVWLDEVVETKPIAVFSKYIDMIESTGGNYNLAKKQGFEKKEASPTTMATYFPGLKGCDDNLDVTTKFSYTSSSLAHPATTTQQSVALGAGTYVYYQPAVVYVCRMKWIDTHPNPESYLKFLEESFRDVPQNEGIRYKIGPNRHMYVIFTVFRDQLIVKPYSAELVSPVPYEELLDYLIRHPQGVSGFPLPLAADNRQYNQESVVSFETFRVDLAQLSISHL
ncbi:hypothetical protein DFA_00734 [Cavenderia fasciculata]|uniref:Monalysin Pore-forming domain-containing protein n=1 Tax=Cavenderia fasciculata TaxID=261658 RepID=F4PTI7_CACFS|nr:uncharacterized protein DFA_00734 [Cavenderia fasciculata]EGG20869.1 hypothetical protein DFA_00734 [Cavenderia fasciculata]|eukprot:XP_004358719.1 hypothetical protein DFA_00734 [Cavenderia fasciculata]